MDGWGFSNGGVSKDASIKAPSYNDPFYSFLGQTFTDASKLDPALSMTLQAGGAGGMSKGLQALLPSNAFKEFQYGNGAEGGTPLYTDEQLKGLAGNLGIDVGDRSGKDLTEYLDSKTQDYVSINGMSAGWNPSADARQSNSTLYKREDGKLVPYQTSGYSAPTKGSWVAENPFILAPLGVVTGGLAYGALAGAGAGAAGGAAAGEAAGAGTAGAAGAGAAGTGGSGLGSLASGLQGWYAGLPGWGQGALTGAAQGGVSSALQGKDILRGALMGGLTGGVGAVGGGLLSSATGLPSWASRAAVSSGLGGLSGGWRGALGAGLGSLASTGLSSAGVPGSLAGKLGSTLGNAGAGAILGGSAGGSGGGSTTSGQIGAPSTAGGAASGGLSGGWRMPSAADAQTAAYLKASYGGIADEAQKKRLAESLLENMDA